MTEQQGKPPGKAVLEEMTDEKLLAAGDEGLEIVFRRHQQRFKTVAWRTGLLDTQDELEEVVNRAWAGIVQNICKNPGNIRSFKAVSVTAIRNCARTFSAERKRQKEQEVLQETPEDEAEQGVPPWGEPPPTPEEEVIRNERLVKMKKLLGEVDAELSARDRLLLRLILDERESEEIAAVLRIKAGTGDTAKSRLRRRLGKILLKRGYSSLEDIE
jgi:RNA polymerase sigma factor (sigma-70 family)